MISAIVYTTNTGTTKTYAEMLGEQIHLPVYALAEAKKKLEKGTTILYLGWIMAGSVKGYKEADKYFQDVYKRQAVYRPVEDAGV